MDTARRAVILADTSAWIEYLRSTGSPEHLAMRRLIEAGDDLHTTEIVVLEVLLGPTSETRVAPMRDLLTSVGFIACNGLADHEAAAAIFRRCRAAGETVRSLADCLIAAIALRVGATVLHRDRDFDSLAKHCGLQVVRDV